MVQAVHSTVLDDGINVIKNEATNMLVVSAYTAADSYATVLANRLAEATMTPADFVLSDSGADRQLTTSATKSDPSANAFGIASHIVFVNTAAAKVIWATAETSGKTINLTDVVNFPSVVYTNSQPTAV